MSQLLRPAIEAAKATEADVEKVRAQKTAKKAALHTEYSVPLSFLEDAVQAASTSQLPV